MLIVTVVSLTIGVAISSRAVSTLRQTSYTAQAGQAQKFADAGIEHTLGLTDAQLQQAATNCPDATHTCGLDIDGGGDDVKYYVQQAGGGSNNITFTSARDETYEIDLNTPGLDAINIEWDSAAIVVYAVIKKDTLGNVTLQQKGATDPVVADGCDLAASDPIRVPGTPPYAHKISVSGLAVGSGEQRKIRIRPMCDVNTNIKVTVTQPPGTDLPNQGYTITSTGTYGEAEWTAEVTKMNPALPAIFDYAIFSDTRLTM
jgi:hypothetical protein